jgi:hypothetical protein
MRAFRALVEDVEGSDRQMQQCRLSSVGVVGVGGDAELGVESVEGLLGASGSAPSAGDALLTRLVAVGGFQLPGGVGLG